MKISCLPGVLISDSVQVRTESYRWRLQLMIRQIWLGISPVVQVLSKPCYLAQFVFRNALKPSVRGSLMLPGQFSMGFVAWWRSLYPAARRVFIQLHHNRTLISPLGPSPIRQMHQQTWRYNPLLWFPHCHLRCKSSAFAHVAVSIAIFRVAMRFQHEPLISTRKVPLP
jgi:hypothetical protein